MFNYIINKNHEIQYFDEEFKIYYPNLKAGDICYRTLCGNDAPCYGCPHEVPEDRRWSLFNKLLRQWVNVHYCPMNWQKDNDNILVSVEITENEEYCHHKKNALTGILSREHFLIQAEDFLQTHSDRKWCLAAVDIDNFKLFNEWFGQNAGDQVLKSFGDYFHNLQAHTDSVAGYFGGDDFYVIIPDSSEFIDNMWAALSGFAAKFREGNVFLPAIGIYPIDDITTRISTMCDMAQLAVNSVKADYRKHIERFDNELFRQLEKRQNLILDIQNAMQNKEFCFYLQPKCNMDNDKIISFEALVRWLHPTFGMIPPGEYIPFLEKSRLITELDLYIWESVCIQLAKWRDAGIRLIPISVNVSVADIYAIDVPETFIQLAEKYQIPPRYIIVEITESAYVENFDTVKENVSRLQRHGFAVSMDDFGSGYSSLNMLKDINVDIIKIDMKFLRMNETTREKGLNILSSIIRLVNVLNIRMVAEGVETQEQIKALLTMGCKYGQGYYFYRPVPVPEAEKLLCDHTLIDERGISSNLFNQLSINDLMGKGIIGDKLISELLGPTVICEVQDNHFHVLKINNDALSLLKVTPQEVEDEQESIVNHYFGGDISELLACFETSYANKPERNKFVVKGMRRNGIPLWLELKICFLQEREKWRMYFMTLQDVTPEFGIPKPTLEQVLLECIQILSKGDYESAFQQFLERLGQYYGGKRTYMFSFDSKEATCSNTYEWCAPAVTPEIHNLQNIPLDVIDNWITEFERVGEFYICSLDVDTDSTSAAYKILKDQNIDSLMAAPLKVNGEITGFIGVDDPDCNEYDLTVLRAAADFISECNLVTRLKHTSFTDGLTGLYNRNKYINALEELEQNIPASLGVIFADINGLKRINDVHGHRYGDSLITHYASQMLRIAPKEEIFRIGGDEFVILLRDISREALSRKVTELKNTNISASIGSVWDCGDVNVKELIARADRQMYSEKQKYYNQI